MKVNAMTYINSLEQQLQDAESKAAAIRSQLSKMNSDPAIRLAEELHKSQCSSNHIDQCDWDYGSWDSPGNAHQRYYNKAQELLQSGLSVEQILMICKNR